MGTEDKSHGVETPEAVCDLFGSFKSWMTERQQIKIVLNSKVF